MLPARLFYVLGFSVAAIVLLLIFNSANNTTGFAIFTEKTGQNFALTISGDTNYIFSFKNLRNESLFNATANLTFPKTSNITNYGLGAIFETQDSKILSWLFESVGIGANTSLTFTSDSSPTDAKVFAVDANGTQISESTTITTATSTTTTGGTTTTTAETTTSSSTTTTTVPPFDYDKEGGAEIYNYSAKKDRGNNLPEGWYLKKNLDLEKSDDTETYAALVDKDGKKAIKISGIVSTDARFFSDPIDWSGGNIRLKVSYKPIGNEACEQSAAFGFEVLFSDGTSDTTLTFTADNFGNVSSGPPEIRDFDISSKEKKDGWFDISAKSVVEVDSSKKLRFFASQASTICGEGFYISDLSIK